MALLPFKNDEAGKSLVGRVLAYRQQGLDDHTIIQKLQEEGHTATEIFDALREADAQKPVWPDTPPAENPFQSSSTPPRPSTPGMTSQAGPSMLSTPHAEPPSQSLPGTPPVPSTPSAQPSLPSGSEKTPQLDLDAIRDQLDALAETIIEEKWKELKVILEKIIDWKQKVEGRVLSLEREVSLLKEEVLTIQKSVLQRVEEYDQHIGDVMSEMKAMEKVFQKIIPSLTENVNELRSIVQDLKPKEKKRTRETSQA